MSFLKTLGKVGAIAGGGIATAMTGGAASPLLLAAIGAGTGAAVGGIDHGWKGALTGGALGAATGGLGGGAGSAAASGAKSVGSSALSAALKNPKTYLEAAGALGQIAGKQQEGKAQGAVTQAGVTQAQDRNALAAYQTAQAAQNNAGLLDLDRKKYTDDASGMNAKRAMIAGLLGGGGMGSGISVPGIQSATMSGGPMAALRNNPEALAAIQALGKQSSDGLTNPQAFTGGAMLPAPKLTNLPDVGGSGFMSTLADYGQLAGVLAPLLKDKVGGAPPAGGPLYQVPQNNAYSNLKF